MLLDSGSIGYKKHVSMLTVTAFPANSGIILTESDIAVMTPAAAPKVGDSESFVGENPSEAVLLTY